MSLGATRVIAYGLKLIVDRMSFHIIIKMSTYVIYRNLIVYFRTMSDSNIESIEMAYVHTFVYNSTLADLKIFQETSILR